MAMTAKKISSSGALALAACGAVGFSLSGSSAETNFVPTSATPPTRAAFRGTTALTEGMSTADAPSMTTSGSACTSAFTAMAFTAAVVASSTRSSRTATARRAEPVTAAALAAAAAAKAAAASGAVKVGGAVAGSATTGSLKQSSEDLVFDEELDKKKFGPQDRGTPEYERYMQQKKVQKQRDWDSRTGRNSDGGFGTVPGRAVEGNLYDPLESTDGQWSELGSPDDFEPSMQLGVTEPLGYFDPLGFCSKEKGVANFRQLRVAEIKHGRVAMMAAVGAVAQHYVKFPGFEKVPSGLAAVNVAPGSMAAIALFGICGVLELGVWTESNDKEPGNFGDPLWINQYTKEMRERELNNGRMAMFSAIGIIAAELNTGKDAIQQFGL